MKKLQSKKGFTLSELLIVVAIIAVLVAIAIPNFMKQLERSREQSDFALMEAARAAAVSAYYKSSSTNGILDAWNGGSSFYYDISTGKVAIDGSLPTAPYGNGTDSKAFATVSEEYDEVCCDAAYPTGDGGLASTQNCVLSCYLDEAGLMHVHWTPASGMVAVNPSTPTSPVPAPSIPPKPSPSPKPTKTPAPTPVPTPIPTPVPTPEPTPSVVPSPSATPSGNPVQNVATDWPIGGGNGERDVDFSVVKGQIVSYGGEYYIAGDNYSYHFRYWFNTPEGLGYLKVISTPIYTASDVENYGNTGDFIKGIQAGNCYQAENGDIYVLRGTDEHIQIPEYYLANGQEVPGEWEKVTTTGASGWAPQQ